MKPIHLMIHTVAAGLLFVGSPALPVCAHAQVLEFEQVGDIPIDAEEIDFDHDSTLWAITSRALYRLQAGAPVWEEVNDSVAGIEDNILVLSPDTILLGSRFNQGRSTDGGQSFVGVYLDGGRQFAALVTGPNHGVILTGTFGGGSGIAYSTDRGASFTESTFTVSTSSRPFLEDAVEIPDGTAEGRLVAGVFAGVVISEDGGQTWEPSSMFQNARFWVHRVEIGTNPATGKRRLYATVADAQLPDVQFYYSDDDGLTWTNVPGMVDAFLFVFVPGTESFLLAVERGTALEGDSIEVWRSIDGGGTWSKAGRLPAEPEDNLITTKDILIGPEGHVYVSVFRTGPEPEWVYRTTEPVVVANEPEAPPPPTAERLIVYPNPATDRLTVEATGLDEKVRLYNLLGRLVSRASLSSGKASLDVSRLPAGVYVVQVGTLTQHVTLVK